MSLPAPAPSADNSDGREPGRAAVRGWELIRNLQVEPLPRRPHRRRIMEGERELRGGGMRLEFVRGGMGRSRRPGGRSNNNFQNRSVLLPDCVPESARRIADENGDESGFNRDGPFELSAGNDGATHETRGTYISQRPDLCEGPTNNEPEAVGPNIRNSSGQVEAHQVPVQAPLEAPQAPLEALQVPPEAPQVPVEQALFKVEGCSPQEIVGEPQRADPVPLIPYLQNMTIMGELSILETSTLSPNAREFIPTSKQVSSMSGQLPGTVSNGTDEVYPTNSSRYYQNGEQVSATGAYSYQDETLEYFDQMVETLHLVESELIKHPANFHNMMKHIACAVPQWLQSNLAVSLANSVINMGMNHKNFGYIAARMCVFISKLDPSNVFRTSLINRCHEICQNLPEQRKCATFVWFVMFLAELYVQFKNERGQRVNVIGTGLLECLENLISEPVVYDNLKFFCNALKLAGHYLDTDLKTPMNQLMTHIQSVMTAVGFDNVDSRMYNQLQRIIDMRNNNWDIQSAASLERQEEDGNNVSNSGTCYSLSDAVFYGPDGQVLTQEESQFLTENQSLGECNQSESFDEDSSKEDSNDSMDEEMQVAYEQFLQMVPGRQ